MGVCPILSELIGTAVRRQLGVAPTAIERLSGFTGHENFAVRTSRGDFVLKAAADGIATEAWVCQRVGRAGVPVPEIVAVELDCSVLPLPFLLMTRVSGGPMMDDAAAVEAGKLFQDLGHVVEEVTPDISYLDMTRVCFELFLPGMSDGVFAVGAMTGIAPSADSLEPPTLATIERSRRQTVADLRGALDRMVEMSRKMAKLHETYDILLTPAVSRLPCAIGKHHASTYPAGSTDFWEQEGELYEFSPLASITGQPALVLPFFVDGCALPVGIQLMAKNGDEATTFQLGGQLERSRPWISHRPQVHATD